MQLPLQPLQRLLLLFTFQHSPGRSEMSRGHVCLHRGGQTLPCVQSVAILPMGDLKKKRAAILKLFTLSRISLPTQLHFAKALTNGGLTPCTPDWVCRWSGGFYCGGIHERVEPLACESLRLSAAPSARPSLSLHVCNLFLTDMHFYVVLMLFSFSSWM